MNMRLAFAALALGSATACLNAQALTSHIRSPISVSRPEALSHARTLVRSKDPRVAAAYASLLRGADSALVSPLVAVTDKKTLMPPSGDKHDYFSLSPYWWPDPAKANGLPYIRRDGETNPESKRDLDQPRVAAMGANVHTLALAYHFSGDEKYAVRAAKQVRTWFLDSATQMNPHLRFSQLVRGIDQERGSGIIDTRWFIETADAIRLLQGSKSWTAADQRGMETWFRAYLTWLRTTPNGKHEHDALNNHGSWYAAQAGTLAMFVGDTATARELVNEAKARIGWQITAAGEQPKELERTRSMHYSAFNVEALSRLAEIGRALGVDLWHYQAPEGGSIQKAIDNLVKFVGDPSKWPGQQITPVEPQDMAIHLRRAITVFGDQRYRDALKKLPSKVAESDRSVLLYPDTSSRAKRGI
jgi:hypothetical protein